MAFTYLKTPDFDDIQFSLNANFETSGGFGSNQVSTALGLGFFLIFIFWVNQWKLSGFRGGDIILLFGMALQGLLTFSRGGMLGGGIGILIILITLNFNRLKSGFNNRIKRINQYAVLGIVTIIFLFLFANRITGGLLSLRYRGETNATIAGLKEKTVSTLTTGRWDIFLADLALWEKYPILGVGVGASQFIRENLNGVAAHVELSRLMAEHGLLGLLFFAILLFQGIRVLKSDNTPFIKGVLFSFFCNNAITKSTNLFSSLLSFILVFFWV